MSRRQRRMEGLSEGGQGTIDGRGLLIVMNLLPFMYCVENCNQLGNCELENKDLTVLSQLV